MPLNINQLIFNLKEFHKTEQIFINEMKVTAKALNAINFQGKSVPVILEQALMHFTILADNEYESIWLSEQTLKELYDESKQHNEDDIFRYFEELRDVFHEKDNAINMRVKRFESLMWLNINLHNIQNTCNTLDSEIIRNFDNAIKTNTFSAFIIKPLQRMMKYGDFMRSWKQQAKKALEEAEKHNDESIKKYDRLLNNTTVLLEKIEILNSRINTIVGSEKIIYDEAQKISKYTQEILKLNRMILPKLNENLTDQEKAEHQNLIKKIQESMEAIRKTANILQESGYAINVEKILKSAQNVNKKNKRLSSGFTRSLLYKVFPKTEKLEIKDVPRGVDLLLVSVRPVQEASSDDLENNQETFSDELENNQETFSDELENYLKIVRKAQELNNQLYDKLGRKETIFDNDYEGFIKRALEIAQVIANSPGSTIHDISLILETLNPQNITDPDKSSFEEIYTNYFVNPFFEQLLSIKASDSFALEHFKACCALLPDKEKNILLEGLLQEETLFIEELDLEKPMLKENESEELKIPEKNNDKTPASDENEQYQPNPGVQPLGIPHRNPPPSAFRSAGTNLNRQIKGQELSEDSTPIADNAQPLAETRPPRPDTPDPALPDKSSGTDIIMLVGEEDNDPTVKSSNFFSKHRSVLYIVSKAEMVSSAVILGAAIGLSVVFALSGAALLPTLPFIAPILPLFVLAVGLLLSGMTTALLARCSECDTPDKTLPSANPPT